MGFHVCQHVLFVVFRIGVGIDGFFFRFPPEFEVRAAGDGGEKQHEDAGQDCFRGLARHWCPRRPQGCRFGPIYRTSKLTQTAPNIQSYPGLAATAGTWNFGSSSNACGSGYSAEQVTLINVSSAINASSAGTVLPLAACCDHG